MVVTEKDGGVSLSDVRRVAIAQRAVGTGLLAEPPAPLPLRPDTSLLGDFVLRSYMPRVAYLCVYILCCGAVTCTDRVCVRRLQHGSPFGGRCTALMPAFLMIRSRLPASRSCVSYAVQSGHLTRAACLRLHAQRPTISQWVPHYVTFPVSGHRLFQYEWAGLLALLVLPRFCPPGLVAWLQRGGVRWALGWPLLALHRTSLIAELWYPQARPGHRTSKPLLFDHYIKLFCHKNVTK